MLGVCHSLLCMGTASQFQAIPRTLKHCSHSGGDATEIAAVQSWAVCRGRVWCAWVQPLWCAGCLGGVILASFPSAQAPSSALMGTRTGLEAWHTWQIDERRGGCLGWWYSGAEDGVLCPCRCGIFDQIWIVTSVCYHSLPLIPTDSFFVVGQKQLARRVVVSKLKGSVWQILT